MAMIDGGRGWLMVMEVEVVDIWTWWRWSLGLLKGGVGENNNRGNL